MYKKVTTYTLLCFLSSLFDLIVSDTLGVYGWMVDTS